MRFSRRKFLFRASAATLAASCARSSKGRHSGGGRILFTSQGRTAVMGADGSGLRWLDLEVPGQVTWQPAGIFPDGRRLLMLSMEARRDGPGRSFEQYYTQTPTRVWSYDLDSGALVELAARDRLAVFLTPQLLLGEDRMLVQVVRSGKGSIFSINLDGSDARPFTRDGDGFPYGLSLSPDGRRVAFHLSEPGGYQVWTSDTDGTNRVRIAAAPGHLYFGTSWSPDGQWILFVDCLHERDPGHDWADVCIGRADGGGHRVLTEGQAMWFAATYGNPSNKGSGSNLPAWMPDGRIVFPRRLPGSRVPWEYQANRPDLDHFNRDFKPEVSGGGTEVCVLNPADGSVVPLTRSAPPVWDFRASPSPDGQRIAFCRAPTGGVPGIWVMNSDGSGARELTLGFEGMGADHPRWLAG